MVFRCLLMTCAFGVGLLGSAAAFAQQSQPASALSPSQRAEVIGLIRQELVQDPSILRDAIGALQAQDQASQASAQSNAIAASRAALIDNAADPVIGNRKGDVTVVEFYDVRCPYCRQMRPLLVTLAQQDPGVRVVFKDIPILGPSSVVGARALLAAQMQGGYDKMQAALMSDPAPATEASLRMAATQIGLNPDRLIHDMSDATITNKLAENAALAQTLGVTGTPALIVGGRLVPGAVSLDDLHKLVNSARG
ncbi:DsbA family protein [Acidisoma cladoniae]|jgi:protein-disulfide isomerase|uniref:DsbA family protein n=1 Tax=Acidisoma cladoniae TaxID=3040935 RepID=UPI00254BCDE2|nr:DsbA family protein [Acidisoma sp. PAMC 29798]